jgi:hypothetical protein
LPLACTGGPILVCASVMHLQSVDGVIVFNHFASECRQESAL